MRMRSNGEEDNHERGTQAQRRTKEGEDEEEQGAGGMMRRSTEGVTCVWGLGCRPSAFWTPPLRRRSHPRPPARRTATRSRATPRPRGRRRSATLHHLRPNPHPHECVTTYTRCEGSEDRGPGNSRRPAEVVAGARCSLSLSLSLRDRTGSSRGLRKKSS